MSISRVGTGASDDAPILAVVCGTCQGMLFSQDGRRRGNATTLQVEYNHHAVNDDTLETCVNKTPCYICRIVYDNLRASRNTKSTSTRTQAGVSTREPTQLIASLKQVPYRSLTFRLDFKYGKRLLASFILVKQGDDEEQEQSSLRPLTSTTCSSKVFDLAREWIVDCEQNHHDVCNSSGVSFYPTRLLELFPATGGIDFASPVKLVSGKISEQRPTQPKFEGKYVTLSHCWGQKLPLTLQKSTLGRFQDAVHLNELPQTFRDAIYFARKLEQRWIWIDALCIVQDSPEDWLHESTLMHKVYANSYFNISATASKDGSQGLFRSRKTNHLWSQSVTVNAKDIFPGEEKRFDCTVLDLSFWENSVERAPVNQRSWVLQERMLSPRVVHWCEDQIAFECRQVDRAECRPQGFPHLSMLRSELVEGTRFKRIAPDAGRELARLRLKKENSAPGSQIRVNAQVAELKPRWCYYEIWKRVVEDYTKMGLTNAGDRLIALSGIARMMKGQMEAHDVKDNYVAGLWQRGIPSQLLWYVNEAERSEPQPLDDNRPKNRDGSELAFRAPSFSWASVETPRGVTFAEITKEGLTASLEVVRLVYLTDDKFGMLTDGYIILKGILRQIHLVDTIAEKQIKARASQVPQYHSSGVLSNISTLARYAFGLPKAQAEAEAIPSLSLARIARWSWQLLRDGEPKGAVYDEVYLDSPANLPTIFGIYAKCFIIPILKTQRALFCLIVQAVDGDYGVRYKRVGLTIVRTYFSEEVKDILTPPTKNAADKGRYYWGPDGRKTGESTICII